MEAPLVRNSSKFAINFQQQPPRLVRWGFHPSSFKDLMIGVTEDGALCRLTFACGRSAKTILNEWKKAWPKTEFVADDIATARIVAWMRGKPFAMKVLMTGTSFQQSVWKQMLKIPAGKTRSYAEVAERIGNPKAVRAVGTACGANPVAIIVPCHRIVGTQGGLGGFGGGLPLKKRMLQAEGAQGLKGLVA